MLKEGVGLAFNRAAGILNVLCCLGQTPKGRFLLKAPK